MNESSRIYVAGSTGMVGSAIVRRLTSLGYTDVLETTRQELDLTDARATERFMKEQRPEYVFVSAAKVGGIFANDSMPVEFLLDNLRIQNNVIQYAIESGAARILFLGSSCIYPKFADQPISEESLLAGPLEPTNEAYAIAKIAGIKLCQAYEREYGKSCISLMPTNLYGPRDNFDLKTSHVMPALIRKFHEAKETGASSVEIWGSGSPLREFLHVDDLADACEFLMRSQENCGLINVGSGEEISIRDLALLVRDVVEFEGDIEFNAAMPDGTPRKLLDSNKISTLGWIPKIGLRAGIADTYEWAKDHAFAR